MMNGHLRTSWTQWAAKEKNHNTYRVSPKKGGLVFRARFEVFRGFKPPLKFNFTYSIMFSA